MNKFYRLVILTAIWSGVSTVQAQNAPDSIRATRLKEVIVKSSRQVKKDSIPATLKVDGKLIEIPQNIISIDNNLLRLQGGFELQDAFRNISGVYQEGSATTNNIISTGNISIRGFTGVSIRRNGLVGGIGAYTQEDEALIEQVDVIKGPAGFLGTSGEPGGSININTKVPRNYKIANVTLSAGSYNFYRAAADLGSAVKDKGFSYRFNVAYEDRGYFFGYLKRNKLVLAPVIQYNFNKNTSLLAEYNQTNTGAENGTQFGKYATDLTLQNDPWRSNYLAEPGLPKSDIDERQVRLLFRHQFNDHLKITSQSAFQDINSNRWTMYNRVASGPIRFDDAGNGSRRSFNPAFTGESFVSQLFVNGNYDISKQITYRLLTGVDYSTSEGEVYQGSGTKFFPFSRNNPQYGLSTDELLMVADPAATYYSKSNFYSGFIYNTVGFRERLFLNFGGRYNWNDAFTHNFRNPEDVAATYKVFNPRAGLTYMIRKDFSAYAIYDQTFQPQGLDINGNVNKPLESYNTEGGLKKDWLGGALTTNLSAYVIKRNNMFSFDPITNTNVQIGQVRSRGIELDVLGSPTRNITLSANYALLSSVTSKDDNNPEGVGKRFATVPRQQINAWAMYTINEGFLEGLSLGLGETTFVDRATFSKSAPNLPDYVKLDATVMYQKNKWYVRGFLDNLTNKRYISAGNATDRRVSGTIVGQNYTYQEGAPLNFKVQVGMRFR